MFERLEQTIEELEIPLDGDALAEVITLEDRLRSKLSAAVGDFDHEGLWEIDGATSMTAWLRHRGSLGGGEAAALAGTARRLRSLPVTRQAWLDGSLSRGQVQAVVSRLNDRVAPLFAEHEAGVVPALVGLSAPETVRAMDAWRQKADAVIDDQESVEPPNSLHLSATLGGRGELTGSLDPDTTAVVGRALRLAECRDDRAQGDRRSAAERRADALAGLCRFFLDHQRTELGGRHRPHLNVVIDFGDLMSGQGAWTADGILLSPERVKTLLCDCAVHRVITDGRSAVLDFGTATRTISAALFTALVLRDKCCRFPGCDRPPQWCEGHHVLPWEEGGATNLSNLVLLCSRHHHLVHRPGWANKLKPDGDYEVTDPRGRCFGTMPPFALPLARDGTMVA